MRRRIHRRQQGLQLLARPHQPQTERLLHSRIRHQLMEGLQLLGQQIPQDLQERLWLQRREPSPLQKKVLMRPAARISQILVPYLWSQTLRGPRV